MKTTNQVLLFIDFQNLSPFARRAIIRLAKLPSQIAFLSHHKFVGRVEYLPNEFSLFSNPFIMPQMHYLEYHFPNELLYFSNHSLYLRFCWTSSISSNDFGLTWLLSIWIKYFVWLDSSSFLLYFPSFNKKWSKDFK